MDPPCRHAIETQHGRTIIGLLVAVLLEIFAASVESQELLKHNSPGWRQTTRCEGSGAQHQDARLPLRALQFVGREKAREWPDLLRSTVR
jgi:hypothetical protein